MSASSDFLLGVDYSEWLPSDVTQIATDTSGNLYILSSTPDVGSNSVVTKLSGDGKTILWQNRFGFAANTMAVDPNGGVYVITESLPGDAGIFVAKLLSGGPGIAWKTPVGLVAGQLAALAADSRGRVYVTGGLYSTGQVGGVIRLDVTGTVVEYTAQVTGALTSIAVDQSGAAFVAGYEPSQSGGAGASLLARLAPDGSAGFYSVSPSATSTADFAALALDATGNAVALYSDSSSGSGVLRRFDSMGAVVGSNTFPRGALGAPGLALDAAGNAYVTRAAVLLHPVKNSVATCGSGLLSVFAPDGSLLQTTYGAGSMVAMGAQSTVFVAGYARASFASTQAGPFPAAVPRAGFLSSLSPNPNAQTFPLACIGNAANYVEASPADGAIAPGEIVTLFGNGLGPEQGVQTQATMQSPFPTEAGNVQVTFDGTPAPLLWVQDAQINAVAPWSLTPGQTTQICASYNNVKTNCLTVSVIEAVPAVFTVDGVYAAALNQDGSINSANNPAAPGSIVSVFATGLGPITPPQADGTLVGLPLPNNALPITVFASQPGIMFPSPTTIDTPFVLKYAGPAPYLVAGATQINFQVTNYKDQILLSVAPGTSAFALSYSGFQVYVAGQ